MIKRWWLAAAMIKPQRVHPSADVHEERALRYGQTGLSKLQRLFHNILDAL